MTQDVYYEGEFYNEEECTECDFCGEEIPKKIMFNENFCSEKCNKDHEFIQRLDKEARKNLTCMMTESDWEVFFKKEHDFKIKEDDTRIQKIRKTKKIRHNFLLGKMGWRSNPEPHPNNRTWICKICDKKSPIKRRIEKHIYSKHTSQKQQSYLSFPEG